MLLTTTRRRFLRAGIGGAALLGIGGACRWIASGYALPRGDFAFALSAKEMVVVRAIVEALFPGEKDASGALPSGLELEVHQRVDEEVWAQPDDVRSDLTAALQLIEHAPPLLGSFSRFSALAPEERRVVYLQMLQRGPDVLVQAAVAFKQIMSLHYFTHPSVWPHIGYDGPWVPEAKPPPSHIRYQELLASARASSSLGRVG